MDPIRNDIFRLVNIRGPADEVASDPLDDDDVDDVDGPVVQRLSEADFTVQPGTLDDLDLALNGLDLDGAAQRLNKLAEQLQSVRPAPALTYGDGEHSPASLRALKLFRQDFAATYNLWLFRKLKHSPTYEAHPIERRLRAGIAIYKRLVPGHQTGPSILLPLALRQSRTAKKVADADVAFKQGYCPPDAPDDRLDRFAEVEVDLAAITELEYRLQSGLTAPFQPTAREVEDTLVVGRPAPGILGRISALFAGEEPERATVKRTVNTLSVIDDTSAAKLTATLNDRSREIFDDVIGVIGGNRSVNAVIDGLAARRSALIEAANGLYWEIVHDRPISDDALPSPRHEEPLFEQGAVEALGWGDLIVARETLIDYDAREIAHIENVLKNEKKNREHTLTKTIEETFESETTEREESERELETTSRNELHVESEKAIEQNFSIQAGVNTSGRYGLTKVETSLDAGFQRSTKEAQASTTEIAKEIVSKAVERTFKSVRELRRRTVTTEIRDVNIHELDNVQKAGGSETASISGIYKWVEKVHQVELRHYGTRMMVEFSVPEPALSIVGREDEVDVDIDEPIPPRFDAGGVTEGKYLAYARLYGAKDIEPPPPAFINVGFAWSSQPSESDNENKSEDVFSEYVAIPDDYRPVSGEFNISAHPSDANHFQIRLHIADHHFSKDADAHFSGHFLLTGGGTEARWPAGVPVSMTAHGHFDKTMSMNITFVCFRRTEAWRKWQIATYDKIVEGYERQRQEFQAAVEEARLASRLGTPIQGGPDAINRRTEREELQKWATKFLRRVPFELDATVSVGSGNNRHDEIDPARADQQAVLVSFYQEAFEWDNMSYFFYPYFWGRRDAWSKRQSLRSHDPRFESFLRAGAARVVVPITPGYEARILYYLSNPEIAEALRITGSADLDPTGAPPIAVEETIYNTLWLELALNKNEELALGSGFLEVTQGSRQATIVDSRWEPSDRDIGRELYISGDRYLVDAVVDTTTIELSSEYARPSDPRAAYATGSVAFGPPWIVKLPTNLVVLNENKDMVRLRS